MRLLILLLLSSAAYGQSTYYIRADSIRFQKTGGNTTFILENATRAKTGAYLRNRLDGRTDFYYAVDSASVSGSNLILWRGGGTQNITVGIPASGTDWSLLGNASTVAGTNFVGTTDAVALMLKTNAVQRLNISSAGQFDFGLYGATISSTKFTNQNLWSVDTARQWRIRSYRASDSSVQLMESKSFGSAGLKRIEIKSLDTAYLSSFLVDHDHFTFEVHTNRPTDTLRTQVTQDSRFWSFNGPSTLGNTILVADTAGTSVSGIKGGVGVGVTVPLATFHVAGDLRFVTGDQGAGKVLTSDADGDATWTAASAIGVPISSLTAATGTNTIDNANNSQIWQWNSLSAIGLTLQSNTTAAAGGSALLYLESTGANASSGITQSGIAITNNHSGTTSTNIGANINVAGATTNYGVLSSASASATTNIGGSFSASGATTNNAINIAAGALTLNNSAGTSGQVLTSAGANTLPTWTTPASGGTVIPSIYDFRITTETGVPVPTGDNTSEGTIYMTPFKGNHISLYSGAAWVDHTTAEISLALTVTSGKNYDVFAYNNAGTITLELSAEWTNDNTRADALTRQDGVWVKSGATTRRWIGTIRASGSNVTEDSEGGSTTQVGGKRFVWNAYNQVQRTAKVVDKTDSWVYTTATWRQGNGNSGNQAEYVTGDPSMLLSAKYNGIAYTINVDAEFYVGVGISSTTAPSGSIPQLYSFAGGVNSVVATYDGTPGLGYFYIVALEKGATGGSSTFRGDWGGAAQSSLSIIITN